MIIVYFRATWRTFQPTLGKRKYIHPPKNSSYFRKCNFLTLILKKFRKRKSLQKFLIFQVTETLKKLFIFRETEPFSLPRKNFLYFRKREPRKKIFIFQETETPKKSSYFWKRNYAIFEETELFDISGKVYSEL